MPKVDIAAVPERKGTGYPPQFNAPSADRIRQRLGDAGADFLVRLEPILAALEEAEHAVRGTGELRGILRVGLSTTFAIREVVPRLPVFLESHPALRIALLVDDHRQDLIGDGVDVALRLGALPDSTARARRIAAWPRVLAASPSRWRMRSAESALNCGG